MEFIRIKKIILHNILEQNRIEEYSTLKYRTKKKMNYNLKIEFHR